MSNFDYSLSGIFKFLTADSKELFEMSYESFENTEGTVKTWLGPVLLIILGNPEDVKIVFKSKECINKPEFMKFYGASENILFGDYEVWNSHRKIINPYFNVQGVKAFIPLFNEKVKILMESFKKMEGKGEFDIFYYLTSLSLETIIKIMEYDTEIINLSSEGRVAFVTCLRDFLKAVSQRIFKPWLHLDVLYQQTNGYKKQQDAFNNTVLKFAPDILKNAYKKIEETSINEVQTKSFIRDIIQSNFNEKEILDEIMTLLVAAQDTSANTASTVLLLLAMYKNIQQKVLDELHQVFGKSIQPSCIDQDKLNELKYLEMVMNEAMRLMPVVPIVFRRASEEISISDGYTIPVGSNILIPIIRIHKNKKFWGDDAECFRPERFEKENIKKVHTYAFIPFTKGPRMCLGYRYAMTLMKIQLVNFLMKYEVDTSLKFEELEYELTSTMSVLQGYMIRIKERKL